MRSGIVVNSLMNFVETLNLQQYMQNMI